MQKQNWFTRLVEKLGGDKEAVGAARTQSKHQRGRTKPPGYRRALRNKRKAQRQARKAQRGKR